MTLDENQEETSFTLKSTDPKQNQNIGFICQVPAKEVQEQWVSTVKKILQSQKDFLNALQNPIAHQNES